MTKVSSDKIMNNPGVVMLLPLLLLPLLGVGGSDPWGEDLSPRLRVNYLSQKSGRTRNIFRGVGRLKRGSWDSF